MSSIILKKYKKKYFNKKELSQKGNRNAIPVNFDWASEANFYLDNKNKNIILEIWPADTKGQGDELYKEEMEDRALSFLDESELKVNNDIYKLNIQPYIKFANWNRGVKWINNLLNIENNYKDTHNYNTFDKLAGRYKNNENKNDWKDLEKILDDKISGDWRKSVSWKEKFIKSGKTTIDISLGAKVEVEIPYSKAQKLDDDKDDPKLVKEIYDILTNLKEMIDQ